MYSSDDKKTKDSAPDLTAPSGQADDASVQSEPLSPQELLKAAEDNEDQFYALLNMLKDAVDAEGLKPSSVDADGLKPTAAAAVESQSPSTNVSDLTADAASDAGYAAKETAFNSVSERDDNVTHFAKGEQDSQVTNEGEIGTSAGPLAQIAKADAAAEVGVPVDEDSEAQKREELKRKLKHLHRYQTAQQKCIREHIEKYFGKIYLQVEDVKEDGLHIDIDIIKADREQGIEHTILVTKGMGAYRMRLPDELVQYRCKESVEASSNAQDASDGQDGGNDAPTSKHAPEAHYERCELYMVLPDDMDIESDKDEDSWPISMLNALARLPYIYNAWVGPGHIFTFNDENAAPTTDFKGAMLLPMPPKDSNDAQDMASGAEDALLCELPADSGKVNFYRVVPLYEEELAYIDEHSARTLMRCMDKDGFIADAKRPLTRLRKVKPKQPKN